MPRPGRASIEPKSMPYRSIFRPGLLEGQTVIVTGGGSGIGRCIAHEVSALGAHLELIGRRIDPLREVAGEIEAEGGTAGTHSLDIRDEEGVKATIAEIVAHRGALHGLVNNAGGQFAAPLAKISRKGFEAVLNSNLTGGFLMSREAYLQHMAAHGGAIVNIVADFFKGMPTMGHSGAARAGMDNFTKTASVEWAPSGVRVNAVAPGWVASSGFDTYDEETTKTLRQLHKAVPLQRLGTEAEVSAAVVFLLSEAAAFITGETLRVDGGAPLAPLHHPLEAHDRSQPFEGFHLARLPKALSKD